MGYLGNPPTSAAFVTDTFNGTGSQTAYTMSVAPASTSSMLVIVGAVLQDPSTYSIVGMTLNFSAAPPSGTGNISVRYMGIPAAGVVNTAYRTVTDMTATAGQITFTVPGYTVGFIDVFRNGVRLGNADFTATSGVSVVLAVAANANDLITTVSFSVSSVLNAIPNTPGAVTALNLAAGAARANFGAGAVLQVVNNVYTGQQTTTSSSFAVVTGMNTTITPSSSSSKILCVFTGWGNVSGSGVHGIASIFRNGSTNLISSYGNNFYTNAGGYTEFSIALSCLDTPSTASPVVYGISIRNDGAGTFAFGGNTNRNCSLTLMEIAA
jgi:hypothetical protein